MKAWLRTWIARFRRGRRFESEMADELAFHLQSRIDDLMATGLTPEEATRRARIEFGGVDLYKERCRDSRHSRLYLVGLGGDLRYALRTFRRSPGFATAIVMTLALGIGASTAIFSVFDAVLLRPLPYRDPAQLVLVHETYGPDGGALSRASYPDFTAWRNQSRAFSGLEGYDQTNVTVEQPDGAVMLSSARVTAGFFRLLGVRAALGRPFEPGDEAATTASVVLLGNRYWRQAFGGDPAVVGRTLTIDHRSVTVVGILPAGFRFAPAGDTDLWLPVARLAPDRARRGNHSLAVVGRLRDGVSPDEAGRSLNTIMARLALAYPDTNRGRSVRIAALRDEVAGGSRPVLVALLAAVGVLLLVACANVAGLMLTRSLVRARELGVRAAIGASRGRLMRQLLTEASVLATAGALLGAALAGAAMPLLIARLPDRVMDRLVYLHGARPDGAVLVVTAALTVFATLACGLAPAWLASRRATTVLPGTGGTVTGGSAQSRARDLLVAAQIALTAMLLIGSMLIGRSLLRLVEQDPGFSAAHVLTARVPLAGAAYQLPSAQQQFFARLLERIRQLPGVVDAGAVTKLPLDTGGGRIAYRADDQPEVPSSERPEAVRRGIAGDYFRVMGIPLVAGRTFDGHDDAAAPHAIIVNQSFARRLFAGAEAIGHRLWLGGFGDQPWTIVGVVGDVKTGSIDAGPPPTIYYSHLQRAENRMTLTIRTRQRPDALLPAVRAQVRALDPSLPVYGAAAMSDAVADTRPARSRRDVLFLIGAFGLSALGLALIGVYGVVALTVAQRARELGIRAALGATRVDQLRLVLRRVARLAVIGTAAGCLLALAGTRAISALLYGVPAHDPLSYAAVVLLLCVAVTAASVAPARRAVRIDPAVTLRAE